MTGEFDPYGVPAAPVVSIDFHVDGQGREQALVDSTAVTPRPGESARTAALRRVSELIGTLGSTERPGVPGAHGIRVRLNGPDVRGYEAIIDRQGRLFVPVGSATPSRRPEPGSLVAVAQQAFDRAPKSRSHRQGVDAVQPSEPEDGWSATFLDATDAVDRGARPRLPDPPEDPETTATPRSPGGPGGSAHVPDTTARPNLDDRILGLLGSVPAAPNVTDSSSNPPHQATNGGAPRAPVTGRPMPAPRRFSVRPAVIGIAIAALLAAGGLVAIVAGLLSSSGGLGSPGLASASPVVRPFPGTPPPGFSAAARWVSEPVETGRIIALGDEIAYLTATRRLTVVDAMTGAKKWSATLPVSGSTTPLARTRIDGQEVLATQVGSTLAWWRLADGRDPATLALPEGARTTFLGEAPLVGIDPHTVAVVTGAKLRRVQVPGGAYAFAANAQGRVTAASGLGWWHLRPGSAPGLAHPWEDAAPDEQAPRATPSVVGYLGSSVLLLYPPDRSGQLHVVVHTDRAEDLRASFRGRIAPVPGVTQPWWPSPAQTWAVLGRTVVDLRRGRVSDLGDWTTTWITQDHAYGTLSGQATQADSAGTRGTTPPDATIPQVVTSAGAAVRARGPEGESIYLLPPG
ncbi:MAG: hypothetical protein Q4P32_08445 [Micrococcales bacterium]|nr:hypothetical protein [Micrococcales bacterium]